MLVRSPRFLPDFIYKHYGYGQKLFNLNYYTGKKSRFFKVFKVPGKRFVTTVSKKTVEKKLRRSVNDNGGFSNAKSSTIR